MRGVGGSGEACKYDCIIYLTVYLYLHIQQSNVPTRSTPVGSADTYINRGVTPPSRNSEHVTV